MQLCNHTGHNQKLELTRWQLKKINSNRNLLRQRICEEKPLKVVKLQGGLVFHEHFSLLHRGKVFAQSFFTKLNKVHCSPVSISKTSPVAQRKDSTRRNTAHYLPLLAVSVELVRYGLRVQAYWGQGTFERYKAVRQSMLSPGCVLCLAAPKVWSGCLTHSTLLGCNDCLRLSTAGDCWMYSVVLSIRVGHAHCAVQKLLLCVSQGKMLACALSDQCCSHESCPFGTYIYLRN